MVEGLILLAVVVLSFQIWLYNKHKYVQLRQDRKYLLPILHSKSIGDYVSGALLLKAPCKLSCTIGEAGLAQVLQMSGVMHLQQYQGDDRLDEFLPATFEIRQIEGLHPFGQHIGIIWPRTAPSFGDEKGSVKGEFFLSVPAFQFLLDTCEACVGVERLGKYDFGGAAAAKQGLLLLELMGTITHCTPRTRQQVGRNLENALMISSIDRVISHAGTFFMLLEKKIAATIDKDKKEKLSQILSWGNPSASQSNVPTQ